MKMAKVCILGVAVLVVGLLAGKAQAQVFEKNFQKMKVPTAPHNTKLFWPPFVPTSPFEAIEGGKKEAPLNALLPSKPGMIDPKILLPGPPLQLPSGQGPTLIGPAPRPPQTGQIAIDTSGFSLQRQQPGRNRPPVRPTPGRSRR